MKPVVADQESLRRFFAASTEYTFQVDLGLVDPPLIDYLVDMLVRFVRVESIYRIRDAVGQRLEEVAAMLIEAEQRQSNPRREIYRHIGDFTLFWTGVYPEALGKLSPTGRDHLLDYLEQGKRSYLIASTYEEEPYNVEAPILKRLSQDFELCTFGLNRARKSWEQNAESPWHPEQN